MLLAYTVAGRSPHQDLKSTRPAQSAMFYRKKKVDYNHVMKGVGSLAKIPHKGS